MRSRARGSAAPALIAEENVNFVIEAKPQHAAIVVAACRLFFVTLIRRHWRAVVVQAATPRTRRQSRRRERQVARLGRRVDGIEQDIHEDLRQLLLIDSASRCALGAGAMYPLSQKSGITAELKGGARTGG